MEKTLGATGFEPANLSVPNRALYQAELHPAVGLPLVLLPDFVGFLEQQVHNGNHSVTPRSRMSLLTIAESLQN